MKKSLSKIIIYEDTQALTVALKKSDDISYIDEYGYTPLIEAIIIDDVEKVIILLEAGADVNQKDITGRTALFWAIFNNKQPIVTALLKHQADPNIYNMTSEPVLSRPLLQGDKSCVDALIKHGADLTFAYDYINTKLLGHRFELVGSVDIVDTQGVFTEVDFEGFHLEFSLALIANSVETFRRQYVSRTVSGWFDELDTIIDTLHQALNWSKYSHYLIKASSHYTEIQRWLKQDTLVIPVGQEGHAFTLIKCGDYFAIGDRRSLDDSEGIPIYYMNRASRLTADLLIEMVYNNNQIVAITETLKRELGLVKVTDMPLRSQITGNCSWANVEAAIPVLFYMLQCSDASLPKSRQQTIMGDSLELLARWRDWDTGRSLQFCMQEYKSASAARKASITSLLAAIFAQRLSADHEEHVAWAKRIIPYLLKKDYRYILDSYLATYCNQAPTTAGKNMQAMLDIYEREEAL